MSKEFEEIVLKKLEKLDTLEAKFNNLETEVCGLKTEVCGLKTEMGSLTSQVGSLTLELAETKESVKDLNNKFTVFDFEINRKIDTIFDAITANNEKHDLFENCIVSLNTKTFNHDIRISVLEDYNKNAKLFATN